ncbi:MAG TPA: enoyl-CoA hydratase-related protein, partial [Phenylobacterium sp.]|nr:enoyl-CoA hydratase-related protein [Phenylobacterium sp.]
MAVATAETRFAFTEVKLGIIPATISPYVVGAIGARAARALFATGQVFDAAHAEKIGLVSEVVADDAGLDQAMARIAQEMMACGPQAMIESKRLVDKVAYERIDHGLM